MSDRGAADPEGANLAVDESHTTRSSDRCTLHINCWQLMVTLSQRHGIKDDQDEAERNLSLEIHPAYGLGNKRTFDDFCEHIGVNFQDQALQLKAIHGGMAPEHLLQI